MVFLLPALALSALGLGVKYALDGDLAFAPGDTAWRSARAAHREALSALREARLQVRTRALLLAERQRSAVDQTARPFLELLERLERWECLREEDRLPATTHAALRALLQLPAAPVESSLAQTLWSAATRPEPGPERAQWGAPAPPREASFAQVVLSAPERREEALAQALRGASAPAAPASLAPLLAWLERGWVHVEAPVQVQGVSVFEAVALGEVTPAARDTAGHAARLQAHAASLADLHGCAQAQLAYLDAQSFEDGCDELPRARLRRLGVLMGALAHALQQPLLEPSGALAAAPAPPSLPELA